MLFRLNIFESFEFLKCLSIRFKNIFTTLVSTFLMYGGLNHIMLRFLFLLGPIVWVGVYVSFSLYPLSLSN